MIQGDWIDSPLRKKGAVMQPKNIPMKYEELSIGVSTGKIRIPK